jgi:phosphatidylinositol 3-kinase
MISSNGALFHIDYAYILGRDPKPITNLIRITPDMVDALGGTSSIHYIQFKQWCGTLYNCIRRHINLFYNLLLLLEDDIFTKEYIKKYVIERFIPGENYKDAHNQFIKILEQSYDSYKNNIIDYFHKQYRSSSDSIQKNETIKSWIGKWIPKII